VPEGPAGVIAIDVACTAPAASIVPLARRHSPVRRSVEDAEDILVTVEVVGTLIDWLPDAAVITVIDVPAAQAWSIAAAASPWVAEAEWAHG